MPGHKTICITDPPFYQLLFARVSAIHDVTMTWTFPLAANDVTGPWCIARAALIYNPCLYPAFSVYNMAAEHLNFWHFETGHCKYLQNRFVLIFAKFCATSLFDWHIGRAEAKENGKTGLRPLRLVGNFLSMPQSPVFTRSISAEGRTEACGLVLRFHGFTAYQCVRADVGSLNQHPSNNHSLRVTMPASLFINWPFDVGGWGCGVGGWN